MKAPSEPPGDPEFFARLRTALDDLIVDGRVSDVLPDPVTAMTREDLPLARAPRFSQGESDEPEPDAIPDQPAASGFELPRGVLIVIVLLLVGLGATAAAFVFQDRFAQLIVQWHQQGR